MKSTRRECLRSLCVMGVSQDLFTQFLWNYGEKIEYEVSSFCKGLIPVGRILEEPNWNVWGCSPVYGPDGKIHVFFSRWPGAHSQWLRKSEIAHATADNPWGPYEITGTVLKGRGEGHWDADTIHNPTIHKIGEKYALFYIGNNLSRAEEQNIDHAGTQRIGLAIADELRGPFKRINNNGLILDTSNVKSDWDSYLTTNPALLKHPNGEYWLYYKSWDRNNDNLRKMGLAIAQNIEGPYKKFKNNPVVSFAEIGKQVEDAYVWYQGNKFHMIMRDMGVIHPHVGLYLSSNDGLNWSEPQLGYRKNSFYFPPEKTQRFERPQLLMNNGKAEYLFCSLMGGRNGKSSAAVLKVGC